MNATHCPEEDQCNLVETLAQDSCLSLLLVQENSHSLIRDILVASIHDKRLSEGLQMDGADLTMEKAVTCIRQSETVHHQQVFLCEEDTRQFPINVVKTSRRPGKSMSDTGQGSGPSKKTMC